MLDRKALMTLMQDWADTRDRVETALYFDEFEEAEELVARFDRWTGKMVAGISVSDECDQIWSDASDLILDMWFDLFELLPNEEPKEVDVPDWMRGMTRLPKMKDVWLIVSGETA